MDLWKASSRLGVDLSQYSACKLRGCYLAEGVEPEELTSRKGRRQYRSLRMIFEEMFEAPRL